METTLTFETIMTSESNRAIGPTLGKLLAGQGYSWGPISDSEYVKGPNARYALYGPNGKEISYNRTKAEIAYDGYRHYCEAWLGWGI